MSKKVSGGLGDKPTFPRIKEDPVFLGFFVYASNSQVLISFSGQCLRGSSINRLAYPFAPYSALIIPDDFPTIKFNLLSLFGLVFSKCLRGIESTFRGRRVTHK